MQLRAILFVMALAVPAAAGAAPGHRSARDAAAPECRLGAASHRANTSDAYRGGPLRPRKLTELPQATTYMAVYRHVGQCEAPLTMADYRRARR